MKKAIPPPEASPRQSGGTLGDLLYSDRTRPRVPESDWHALVQAIAARDAGALRALYDRAHRLVFTLALRIVGNRESAEELTVDVFHDIWRRAPAYDPAAGTVLAWVMNQARSRAIDRLRREQRKKRVAPATDVAAHASHNGHDGRDGAELAELGRALQAGLARLTTGEREAITFAYFGELTHTEIAARLGQPLGTVKTRIRSGLAKLRTSMDGGEEP